MASAALLKELFKKVGEEDWPGGLAAAVNIADEARKKGHHVLAAELEGILKRATVRNGSRHQLKQLTEQLPRDTSSDLLLLEVIDPGKQMSELVLPQETRGYLNRVIFEYQKRDVLQEFGLHNDFKILFSGPPGCGKTSAAEALAHSLDLPLAYVRLDSLVSSYLGETSSNLRQVFDFFHRVPCVLFFDEFDSVAKHRDDSTDVGELKRVVTAFLQLLDRSQPNGIILCATNHPALLDLAVWRRFDEVLSFPKPDESAMYSLISKLLPGTEFSTSVQMMVASILAGASYADIERVCIQARKDAVLSSAPVVTVEHVQQSLLAYQERKTVTY